MDSSTAPLYPRFASQRVATALADTPVVLVNGPRQCGKTTLAQGFVDADRPYLTLDDATVLAAARNDPAALMRALPSAVIDEVQRSPALLRELKLQVDRDRRPGRYLLTGSANLLTLPQVADSLAGRMAVVPLLPLSTAEVLGTGAGFLDAAFLGRLAEPPLVLSGPALMEAVLAGGYPPMLQRAEPVRQRAWARDYVQAIVQRDVRELAQVTRLDAMPRLLRTLVSHAAQLVNFTQVGAALGLDDKTTRRYVGLLEQVFLLHRLEPWFHNDLKRLVKTPKLQFLDSGLLAALQGIAAERLAADRTRFGPLLETFVFAELQKQAGWSDEPPRPAFYRTRDGEEIDLLFERADGTLVAVEVKAAASVNATDFRGLRQLSSVVGERLALGVVLHDGDVALPFGERLWAAPMACLFGT